MEIKFFPIPDRCSYSLLLLPLSNWSSGWLLCKWDFCRCWIAMLRPFVLGSSKSEFLGVLSWERKNFWFKEECKYEVLPCPGWLPANWVFSFIVFGTSIEGGFDVLANLRPEVFDFGELVFSNILYLANWRFLHRLDIFCSGVQVSVIGRSVYQIKSSALQVTLLVISIDTSSTLLKSR